MAIDDEEDDSGEESLARALADLELVASAYPDEVQLPDDLHRWTQHRDNHNENRGDNDNSACENDGSNSIQFPIRFTFYLDPVSFVVLELTAGYPSRGDGLRVVSFGSNTSETKTRIEAAVAAIRESSLTCLEDGVEAGLMCCSMAMDAWNEGADRTAPITYSDTTDLPADFSNPNPKPSPVECAEGLPWLSGEPFVEKKSVFQAHVCQISSESQCRIALGQLIGGSTKLQRATHNMWAYRVQERVVNPTSGSESVVLKHDNDDDGEDAAGGRLAMLLDVRGDDGVMVVVSRWYGGVQLGPRRFAIIANVARVLLDQLKTARAK